MPTPLKKLTASQVLVLFLVYNGSSHSDGLSIDSCDQLRELELLEPGPRIAITQLGKDLCEGLMLQSAAYINS